MLCGTRSGTGAGPRSAQIGLIDLPIAEQVGVLQACALKLSDTAPTTTLRRVHGIPVSLRTAIAEQLKQLVAGQHPGLLLWVREYGVEGVRLIPQPPEIWTHPDSDAIRTVDGGWHVVLPLWTEAENPSDLFAEFSVDRRGDASIQDVHVL